MISINATDTRFQSILVCMITFTANKTSLLLLSFSLICKFKNVYLWTGFWMALWSEWTGSWSCLETGPKVVSDDLLTL